MKVLIVFAHQEAQSFNAALLARSVAELTALGHTVRISDLYAMHFNPVATAEDFGTRRFPERLQYDREQKYNLQHDALSGDIAAEIEKLLWCDLLILQFPLWWFSVPAIMKGWIDRVFVNGAIYGSGRRYDTGGLAGRRAMVVTSTAAYPGMCATDGLVGALDVVLWPIQNGTLAYAGCKVLPPFVSYSVNFVDEATRHRYLDDYAERLRRIETTEPLFFHPLADFGGDWRLKPGIAARTVGQRSRTEP
ncbi:NAD(P)H-dependent oxidoreductase [Bradyrhizobium acaciae]|uniref:NAD(P)H-dependent oxidoreductase n=1 Tax=Bradyrhizobium acaciae TaxID=2683706 RepID=UPI001E63011E|nr:NAD(P)H-dependent oxidoreductase [Bradyrhizobium acaciae]MCC8979215.1 NAD(P)H-dependent oxidoreductase [Bradyrhizobium acaciae]